MAIRQTEMFDNVQEQVKAASRTGGVTQVAKDPTKDRVQVAGIGDAFIKSFIKSYAKTIKPTVKETPEGADKEVAGNVPTPRQERILEVEQEQQVIKANEEAAKKGEPVDLEQVDRKDYQKHKWKAYRKRVSDSISKLCSFPGPDQGVGSKEKF